MSWELFVDGATNQKGSRIRIVMISPKRIILEKSLRLSFWVTNNEIEYEALQARLKSIKNLVAKMVKVYYDSRLVAGQLREQFETKDSRMQWYLNQVK